MAVVEGGMSVPGVITTYCRLPSIISTGLKHFSIALDVVDISVSVSFFFPPPESDMPDRKSSEILQCLVLSVSYHSEQETAPKELHT